MDHFSSLNRVFSLVTQQERQIFGDQSKAIISTSKGGYKTMLQPMAEVLATEKEVMEEDILPKFVVIVERHGIPFIHAIENMVFHLISSLTIITMIRVILMRFFQNTNFNNNEQNHEGSKSGVESQQIDFTPKQYQTLLTLLQ